MVIIVERRTGDSFADAEVARARETRAATFILTFVSYISVIDHY
jgi:hypothetical protein